MFFVQLMLFSLPFAYFLIPKTKLIPLVAMDRLISIKPMNQADRTLVADLRIE